MITNWNVGDRVKITRKSFQNIENGNRSIHAFPCDSFVAAAKQLMEFDIEGVVSMKFPPGYEVNVNFQNGVVLQLKDHWIEKAIQ